MAFINAHTTKTPKNPDVSAVRLGPLAGRIHDALDNVDFEINQSSNTPSWALVVISSLIVLSDASFFLHSRCLKLVIPVLSKLSAWKRGKGVQELHPVVWKCIVWAFARLREAERLAKAGQNQPLEKAVDMKSVYHFSRQDTRADIGATIIATLLWTPDQGNSSIDPTKRDPNETSKEQEAQNVEDVGNALGVVKDMLKNADRQVRELGKKILVRMLSGIGASTPIEDPDTSKVTVQDWYNVFLAPQLFDNSILSSSQANLLTIANQINGADAAIVSQLSESEVSQHWDELLGIWVGLVSRLAPERKTSLPVPSSRSEPNLVSDTRRVAFWTGRFHADVASVAPQSDTTNARTWAPCNFTFACAEGRRSSHELSPPSDISLGQLRPTQAGPGNVPFRLITDQKGPSEPSCRIYPCSKTLECREKRPRDFLSFGYRGMDFKLRPSETIPPFRRSRVSGCVAGAVCRSRSCLFCRRSCSRVTSSVAAQW